MHDPEPPEVGDREVAVRVGEKPHRIERRDGQRGEEEEPRHVAHVLAAQTLAKPAEQDRHPAEQPDREEHLPKPAEIEVLEALVAEPDARRPSVDAAELAAEAPDDDDHERAEQTVREQVLVARLVTGDERSEEDAGREERRRHPEDRELDVPGAREVVRKQRREVDAEEAGEIRAIVLRRAADHHLHEKQGGHHEEEPGAGALRGRELHVTRALEDQPGLIAPVPAEKIPPSKGREQQAGPTEQGGEREHAVDERGGGRLIAYERLGGQLFVYE